MFDRIRFENDIPDPHLREEEWQTKSLENALLDYRVSADGELFVTRMKYETKEEPDSSFGWLLNVVDEWEDQVDYHGVVEAYCYRRGDDQSHVVTYDLYFTHGRLTSTERRDETYQHVPPRPALQDERGQDLSGGQWQRIALARALYRDAPILFLDEPTAALDAEAEVEIFKRYRELLHGRLSLLITHRFNTVRFADRIIVLEGGRLVEDGTHGTLTRQGGRYAAMFTAQADAYRPERQGGS